MGASFFFFFSSSEFEVTGDFSRLNYNPAKTEVLLCGFTLQLLDSDNLFLEFFALFGPQGAGFYAVLGGILRQGAKDKFTE